MFAGHYATALIAHQKMPKASLPFFLAASQLQDILWLTFHYLGLEPTAPDDVLNATLSGLSVDMIYSHDLLPQVVWGCVIFLIGKILYKSTKIGLVGLILVLGHFALDFFSGHPHHIYGPDTAHAGLGLYASNVYLAIAVEAGFVAFALWYYFRSETRRGVQRNAKNKAAIAGLFIFGLGFLTLIATTSFREWFHIPVFDFGFNTNVPTLIMTYLAMALYLNHFVRKQGKEIA